MKHKDVLYGSQIHTEQTQYTTCVRQCSSTLNYADIADAL